MLFFVQYSFIRLFRMNLIEKFVEFQTIAQVEALQYILMFLDIFKAEPTLRYREKPKSGSIFLGIFSLLILGMFALLLYIRVDAAINMKKNEIQFSQYQQVNDTIPSITGLMFAMRPSNIFSQFSWYKHFFQFSFQYWNQQTSQLERNQLEVCQAQNWRLLGQNYTDIFLKQKLNQSYCPKNALNISAKNFNQNLFRIYLKNCKLENNQSKYCYQIQYYIFTSQLIIEIKFLTKKVIINNPNPVSYYIKSLFTLGVPTYDSQNKNYYLPYKKTISQTINKFRIENTMSLFSIFSENSQEILEDYLIGDYYIHLDQRNISLNQGYIQINFLINEEISVYTRSRSTIDTIFSDVGGLFEIFMLFLIFFFDDFNKIRYQLTVAGSFFNFNEDGLKFQRKEVSLWTYFKHSIFDWVRLLCCYQIEDTQTIIMDQTLRQAREILEMKNMYRRLQFMEKVVESSSDNNLLKIISITKKNHISEFRSQRVLLSYYQNVIKLQEAATVQDAIAERSESFKYLSRKTILEEIQNLRNPSNHIITSQLTQNNSEPIKKSLMKELGLSQEVSQSISYYPIIAERAKSIDLDIENEEVQFQITKAFLKLSTNQKHQVVMKMPIIIVHRILMIAIYLNNLNRRNSLSQISEKNNNVEPKSSIKKNYQKPMKNRIKNSIKNFFCFWDFFEIDPLFRSEHKSQKSNAWFGFINSMVIGLIIYIFIGQIIKLVQFDESKLTINSYEDLQGGEREIKNFMMAMKLPKSKKGLYPNQLNIFNQFSFSFRSPDSTGKFWSRAYGFVPCKAQNWKLLGENFYDQFVRQGLNEAYCLQSLLNFNTSQSTTKFLYFSFSITCIYYNLCSNQLVSYYNQMIEQYKHFPIWLYYLVPEIQANKPNSIVYNIKMSRFSILEGNIGGWIQTYNGYKIITDRSIWPYLQDIEEVKHYGPGAVSLFEYANFFQYSNQVRFVLTDNILVYTRKRTKILDILSYLGGLLSFIVIFFCFFFQKFNQLSYQLNVAESSFNYSSGGKKFSQKKFNFFIYIQYMIFKFLKDVFKISLQWKNIRQFDKTLQETNYLMDTENLLLRLQFLQKNIKQLTDKNFLTCLTLLEHSSIVDIRKKRKILNYFDRVVKQQDAATVQDAVKKNEKSFTYLKDLESKANINDGQVNQSLDMINKKQQMMKQEIYSTLIEYLHLQPSVSRAISEYPIIAQQARQIQLELEFNEIESEFVLSFLFLEQSKRAELLLKIPIIIVHRLRMKSMELKRISRSIYQIQKLSTTSWNFIQQEIPESMINSYSPKIISMKSFESL